MLLLNMVIYMRLNVVGISSMLIMNWWIVWLCEMCVMNMLMNGDYDIYYV